MSLVSTGPVVEQKTVNLEIAGFSISINIGKQYRVRSVYRHFLLFGSPKAHTTDFRIDIYEAKRLPHVAHGLECLFNSENTWAMYRDKAGRFVTLAAGRELIIDEKKACGEIYSKPLSFGNGYLFPLVLPLDALLLINLLSRSTGVLVHSCGVNDNGRGFVFPGTSGAGKSTMAKLWTDETGCRVLSDERVAIRELNGTFFAFGTPWHGDANLCDPGKVKLKKILFPVHAAKNYVERLSAMDAATRMLVRSFPPFWDKDGMESTLSFIDKLVSNVPCYELGFVPDKSAVSFVRGLE